MPVIAAPMLRVSGPDLVIAIPSRTSVGIGALVTFMAAPGGTYVPTTACSTYVQPGGGLAAGNLNGDGAADLAVGLSAQVDLLFGVVP